jgi:nucleoside phosphorylase
MGFRRGRLITSNVFVAGLNNKLAKGRSFQALGCDMESGVFAYVAKNILGGRPWFNLRVVADTLDETLSDYFTKEADMTEILGAKTRQALEVLDELLEAGP